MTGDGWKTEDLQPRVVAGPPSYERTTDKPVRYVAVANDAGVLGYLWAADEDGAAGYEPRTAAGGDAFNAGVWWYQKLREQKALDVLPSAAIAALAALPDGPRTGHVVPGSEGEAISLATLRELATADRP
ncbi:MAG TPA: hypothetical protein VFV67_32060 [Actinophytocola sp.]|uniref:hypothetical protein n=1 Tax=Actinophytocola sp. TaxID=1872138 RepID=UPI002DB90E3C|nr:hypothetical protein [Actinophytocola sp.]HEU5475301.1 hypothetical protein [Actinophytocola sp.]